MAKISNKIRKVVFEGAILKLYGNRFKTEKTEFEKSTADIVLKMLKRTAKENGVNFSTLTTSYKPYLNATSSFNCRTATGKFEKELEQIFYNENLHVLQFEGANFDLVRGYSTHHVYYVYADKQYPYTGDETFTEAERKEFVVVFKKYAKFMDDVITAACAVRDVINSASTTKQLVDTSPELGAFLPDEATGCVALVPVETVKKVSALFKKK